MKRNMKIVYFTLTAILFVALLIYLVIVPSYVSMRYQNDVYAAAQPLEKSFERIGETAEFQLVTDPGSLEPIEKNSVADIKDVLDTTLQQIEILDDVSNTFSPPPYSQLLGQYAKSEVLQDHTKKLVNQSKDALNSYRELVEYFETFNEVVSSVKLKLETFNSVEDINIFEGRSEDMTQQAAWMRTRASVLALLQPPHDVEVIHVAVLSAINDAASGFDDLAYGLAVPADDPIYSAAKKIEAATSSVYEITGPMYDENLTYSRTIKNIQDLSEKLELILLTPS